MFGHCLRRWYSINPTLAQHPVIYGRVIPNNTLSQNMSEGGVVNFMFEDATYRSDHA